MIASLSILHRRRGSRFPALLACVVVAAAASSFAEESAVSAEDWARDVATRAENQARLDANVSRKFIEKVVDSGVAKEDIATELDGLGVAPADLAWVLVTMQQHEDMVPDAAAFLSEPPFQLTLKLLANVASQPYSGAKLLTPASPDFNEALMRSFGDSLAPYAYMHQAVPEGRVEDLLWLVATRRLDDAMLEDGVLTAADLIARPEYLLVRKIFADTLVASAANCVRCSDSLAPFFEEPRCGDFVGADCQAQFETNLDACATVAKRVQKTPSHGDEPQAKPAGVASE